MAIFGDLQDMPLVDLISMLGRRSGLLDLWDVDGGRERYVLALDRGLLLWAKRDGSYLEPLQARSVLIHLALAQRGAFEFTPGEPPRGAPLLSWPLEKILLSTTTIQDELAFSKSLLPDPATRFQAAALEVWLEEPLWSFWEKAKGLLEEGASASELAQRLQLPLEEVRYYLHKLRLVGKVAPVRAYEETRRDGEKQGLFRRLLAALRGKGGGR